MRDRYTHLVSAITWLLRVSVGAVFIFSGFVKAIDPWGTIYKISDYLSALGIPQINMIILVGCFLLCAFEFLLGVFLLTGCFRRTSALLSCAFICVMLPLTLWIAIANPVEDCGCFGEVFVISNWATFWKNVLLLTGIIWLVKFNTTCPSVISPAIQWIAALASFIYVSLLMSAGYFIQPMLDFRPYKTGTFLSGNADTDEEPELLFTYIKEGVKKDFSLDSIPDEEDGWEFLDRKEIKTSQKNSSSSSSGFHFWEGDYEVSSNVISSESENGNNEDILMLLIPDIKDVSPAQTWRINSLHDWTARKSIKMIAVASGSKTEINDWKDISMPEYPIYTADDTDIKELARGNPAVVFLRNGKIIWKSTLQSIRIDDFKAADLPSDLSSLGFDGQRALRNVSWIYLSIIATLSALTLAFRFFPRLHRQYRK